MEALPGIISILQSAIGLDVDSVGQATIERAIRLRMKSVNLDDLDAYSSKLHASQDELTELINSVVVHETSFFRHPEAFMCLSKILTQRYLSGDKDALFKLLSVPCSTGEEPYSIAMCLLECGIPSSNFIIDAIDVSDAALDYARKGIYTNRSFRGDSLVNYQMRYFDVLNPEEYSVKPEIRKTIEFSKGNLVESNSALLRIPYDVIFCRNFFIYLSDTDRRIVIKRVASWLKREGFFFTGPAETLLASESGFASLVHPMAFAFQKVAKDKIPNFNLLKPDQTALSSKIADKKYHLTKVIKQKLTPTKLEKKQTFLEKPLPFAAKAGEPSLTPSEIQEPTIHEPLELASELADQGKFVEAEQVCKNLLANNPDSPQIYYLLALIYDAQKNTGEAEKFYRKVLYLSPQHYDALLHLAFILDSKGESNQAALLKKRAQRSLSLDSNAT